MKRFLLLICFTLLTAYGSSDAAVLVQSTSGAYTTKADIYAANTAADTAGKRVKLTGNITLTSNLTLATDRQWDLRDCLINLNGYALNTNGADILLPDNKQVFTTNGEVTGLKRVRAEWFGSGANAIASAISSATGSIVAVSGNIPNLHTVRVVGGGITRGTDTFYPNPTESQTNTLYVSPTGSNTNDGITADYPLQTIQKAFDVLKHYGPVLNGTWVIQLAAGTYTQSTSAVHSTPSRNRVAIKGPSAGHPNVPTAIIDGTGGANYAHGIYITGEGYVEVRDIKFINFVSNGTRIGVVGEYRADVLTNNVHADNCDWAGIMGNCQVLRVKGGILNNCRSGVVVNGTEHTIGYQSTSTADGTWITNSSQSGVYVSRSSRGHVDFCLLTGNAIGIEVDTNARTHAVGSDFKTNNYAIRTVTGGVLTESNNIYNDGTGNANNHKYDFRAYSGSDLFTQNAYSEMAVAYVSNATPHTGTTSKTTVMQLWTIPAYLFAENDRKIRLRICGESVSASAGTTFHIDLGGTNINLTAITDVWSNQSFVLDVEIWAGGVGNQKSTMALSASNLFPRVSHQASAIDMSTAKTIDVAVTLGNPSDSVTVTKAEVFLMR